MCIEQRRGDSDILYKKAGKLAIRVGTFRVKNDTSTEERLVAFFEAFLPRSSYRLNHVVKEELHKVYKKGCINRRCIFRMLRSVSKSWNG